ncbi:MAG: hypothetical protein IPL32_02270 [Chloracidobacterium sp.]|nr:hypothetical protein [Chloracidobacterium sp.]
MKKHLISLATPVALFLLLTLVSGCGAFLKKVASSKQPESSSQKTEASTKVVANSSRIDDSASLDELAIYSENLLKKGRFDELTTKIDQARVTQDRLPGGYWKLYALYEGISVPNYEKNATPSEWEEHISRLTDWKAQMPNSVASRIALAGTLVNYGWFARGGDFVDKISDESMQAFHARAKMAEKELREAKELKIKCPRWYETMLSVGLALGWRKAKYDEVLEEGFHLAPTYYHLPRQKMNYLLPQWMGEPGDIAKFVNAVSERIGGDEGSIMYYELSATLWPEYSNQIWEKTGLDRRRAKEGYDTLKRIYGVDRYRKNLCMAMSLSLMSGGTPDPNYLEEAVNAVGEDWDDRVWGTRERFEERRKMMRTTIDMMKKSPNLQPQNNRAAQSG